MNKLAKVICDIISLNRTQDVEDWDDKYEIWEACAEEALASDEAQTIEALSTTLERISWTNYFLAREPKWKPTHKHYTGGLYRVLSVSRHTDTDEMLVNYDGKSGQVWSRPVDDFYGEIEINTSDMTSHMVKRFEPINDTEEEDNDK